jgi:hypothetical protein
MARNDPYGPLLARERINVRSHAELELWTEILDVYVGDIVMAVGEVGNVSADVLEHLLVRGLPGSRSRTPRSLLKRSTGND